MSYTDAPGNEPVVPEVTVTNLVIAKRAISELMYTNVTVRSCKYNNNGSSQYWAVTLDPSGDFPSPTEIVNCPLAKSYLQRRFQGKGRIGEVLQQAEIRQGNVKYSWKVKIQPPLPAQKTLDIFIKSAQYTNSKIQAPELMSKKERNGVCAWIRRNVGCAKKVAQKICFVKEADEHTNDSITLEDIASKYTKKVNAGIKDVIQNTAFKNFSESELIQYGKTKFSDPSKKTTTIDFSTERRYPKLNPSRYEKDSNVGQLLYRGCKVEERQKVPTCIQDLGVTPEINPTLKQGILKMKATIPPPKNYHSITELYRLNNDLETLAALRKLQTCSGHAYASPEVAGEMLWVLGHLGSKGLLQLTPSSLHELYRYAAAHTAIPDSVVAAFSSERRMRSEMSTHEMSELHYYCHHRSARIDRVLTASGGARMVQRPNRGRR